MNSIDMFGNFMSLYGFFRNSFYGSFMNTYGYNHKNDLSLQNINCHRIYQLNFTFMNFNCLAMNCISLVMNGYDHCDELVWFRTMI